MTFSELKIPSYFRETNRHDLFVKTEAIYSKYGDDIYNAVSLHDGEFYYFFGDHEVREYGVSSHVIS